MKEDQRLSKCANSEALSTWPVRALLLAKQHPKITVTSLLSIIGISGYSLYKLAKGSPNFSAKIGDFFSLNKNTPSNDADIKKTTATDDLNAIRLGEGGAHIEDSKTTDGSATAVAIDKDFSNPNDTLDHIGALKRPR